MREPHPTPVTRRWPFLVAAAAGFAVLMTVGPIILTSGVDAGGSGQSYAGYNVGMMAARSGVSTTPADLEPTATVSGAAPVVTVAPPLAEPAVAEPDPAVPTVIEALAWDTSLAITLTSSESDISDGGTATWKINVSNETGEYLWGVYAYLEGFGPVSCDSRQLDIGDSTTCWAEQTVWLGSYDVVAWTTAWTADRMLENQATIAFTVAP